MLLPTGLAFLFSFSHPELVEGFGTFFFLYSSFCLIKRKQNSRQNDASAHGPLSWPAVLPGRGFFSIPFLI
jgi:hypothetical protein